jgi:hypothetical protein
MYAGSRFQPLKVSVAVEATGSIKPAINELCNALCVIGNFLQISHDHQSAERLIHYSWR